MKKNRKIVLGVTSILVFLSIFLFVVWRSSVIPRLPLSAPEASYRNWDVILSHPKPIIVRTYSTGLIQTPLSSTMNLKHEQAQNIKDVFVSIKRSKNVRRN